jgi:CRISPR/Cas system-associated endoribonuclease Cas2
MARDRLNRFVKRLSKQDKRERMKLLIYSIRARRIREARRVIEGKPKKKKEESG